MIYRFGDNFLEDANLDGELYLAKKIQTYLNKMKIAFGDQIL